MYDKYLEILDKRAKKKKKKSKKRKLTSKPSSETNLRDWFKRKGPKGSTGGWVDCNTCRKGKCKPCGRQEGEKRKKYPACRPTPAACKKYKATKGKSWGKGGKRKNAFKDLLKEVKGLPIKIESYEVEDYKDFLKMDRDFLDAMSIHLDSPVESKKSFSGSEKFELPFDYGELKDIINPADDMGWDIIIVPSQSGNDINQTFEDYEFVGIVKYDEDKDEWDEEDRGYPGENHKLIIAIDGEYEESDVKEIEDFFGKMWQFEKVEWF
jgi:hypothetical protein